MNIITNCINTDCGYYIGITTFILMHVSTNSDTNDDFIQSCTYQWYYCKKNVDQSQKMLENVGNFSLDKILRYHMLFGM